MNHTLPLSLLAPALLLAPSWAQEPVPDPPPPPPGQEPAAETAPPAESEPGSAEISIDLEAPESRANSEEVEVLLAKMHQAHQGILRYDYAASIGIKVMMGGGEGSEMDATFERKGSVTQGGPLGTLIMVEKGLELPGMGQMMNEKSRILVRSQDLMIDYLENEMAAMTGGPMGLTRISKKELTELSELMPMPAPMDFVMMQTPAKADPRALVEAIVDQAGLDTISKSEGKTIVTGRASAMLMPEMGPSAEGLADIEVRLHLDAKSSRLVRLELGPSEKPRMTVSFSEYTTPEKLDAASFNLNPDGREVAELAPLLRQQFEAMTSMGSHGGDSWDDEDEF